MDKGVTEMYTVRPYKKGFMIVRGNDPVRTPDKRGRLVWRTYPTREAAEAAIATLED